MTTPANPVLHTPAHKQTDPAKHPSQIVSQLPDTPIFTLSPASFPPFSQSTSPPPRNVWVHAVQQDKEQEK